MLFDNSKAAKELGYTTRPYQQTIHDEVQWMLEEGIIEGTVEPKPTQMTNAEIREDGAMAGMVQAMDHDATDLPTVDGVEVYKAVEQEVEDIYQKIESGVVGTYKKIESSVVGAYKNVEDSFVGRFLTREGESVEEAKERLREQNGHK